MGDIWDVLRSYDLSVHTLRHRCARFSFKHFNIESYHENSALYEIVFDQIP